MENSNNGIGLGWILGPIIYFIGYFCGASAAEKAQKEKQRDDEIRFLKEELFRIKYLS